MNPPKIYGLVGYPVKHSLSPLMHNAAFKALNIDAEYRLFEIEPGGLGSFFSSLKEKDIYGLNVTVPYKEEVIPFLTAVSSEARLIGAVNTVRVSEAGLEGFNTDGEGFLRHLSEDLKFIAQGKNIALLGAGGASRAVSVYLSLAKAKRITIYDINKDKARSLVESLRGRFKETEFKDAASGGELNLKACQLLVNATPIGMKESDPLLIEAGIHPGMFVYDLIYNPPETKLLALAKKSGAKTSNGLGMLLYQGALSFEYFTARKAPLEAMRESLRKGAERI